MNYNLNRRNSYVFKPLLNDSLFLKVSKARSKGMKKKSTEKNEEKRKVTRDRSGNINQSVPDMNNIKDEILNVYSYLMITKIPTLICGESLD